MSPRSRLTASGRGRQSGSGSVTVTCCVESVSVKHGETGKKKQMNKKKAWLWVVFRGFISRVGPRKNNLGRHKLIKMPSPENEK